MRHAKVEFIFNWNSQLVMKCQFSICPFFHFFSLLIFSTEFHRRRWSARVATSSNFPRRSRLKTFEIQYFLFDIYWYLWYRIFINQVEDFTLLVEDCYWIVIHDILVELVSSMKRELNWNADCSKFATFQLSELAEILPISVGGHCIKFLKYIRT